MQTQIPLYHFSRVFFITRIYIPFIGTRNASQFIKTVLIKYIKANCLEICVEKICTYNSNNKHDTFNKYAFRVLNISNNIVFECAILNDIDIRFVTYIQRIIAVSVLVGCVRKCFPWKRIGLAE